MERLSISPGRLLGVLTVVMIVLLVLGGSTSGQAFGLYNFRWDGTTEFRSELDATTESTEILVTTAYEVSRPEETATVVLAPTESYSPAERERISQYVREGGTLVVAADFDDEANPLLESVGAEARFRSPILRDEVSNHRTSAMPIATNVSDHPLTDGVGAVTLNYGTAVRPNGAQILISTSPFGYLDSNSDGTISPNETVASYPVATVESVGNGRVIVLGDPSLFVNRMLDLTGNRALVGTIFDEYDTVRIDTTHAGSLPPIQAVFVRISGRFWLQIAGAAGLVSTLVILDHRRHS